MRGHKGQKGQIRPAIKRILDDLADPDEDIATYAGMNVLRLREVTPEEVRLLVPPLRGATTHASISVRFFAKKALNAVRHLSGLSLVTPPPTTAHGCLLHYITTCEPNHFQPINTNYGLFPPLPTRIRDKEQKRRLIGERAVKDLEAWKTQSGLS